LLLTQLNSMLNIPVSTSINMTLLYLYYFIGVTVISIITGVVPGIFLSNISEIKVLKKESIFTSRGFQRKILLTFQLVIVAVLINSTFIIKNQISYILNKDLGFNCENIVYLNLDKDLLAKKELLKNNLLKNNNIKYVSFSDELIGDGFAKGPKNIGEDERLCYFISVDPDYLELFHMKIKYGRNFLWEIKTDCKNSCIVNEAACKAFGIKNPTGKFTSDKEIIGVVNDFNFSSLQYKIEPLIISCGDGNVAQLKIYEKNQIETLNFIKKTCKDISPDFESDCSFLNTRIKNLYKSESNLKSSFIVYSMITLIIALLGLFGLTMFLIKKKTKETSIRKLYGARLRDTYKLLSKENVQIVFVSNILAIPISILAMKGWLNNFQFRADIGFLVYLKTFAITLAFTLIAISFFIYKTHKTNLVETLKHE
jgi:putative ABC transport system permease protein